ncbi:MAG TPA: NDP-sugar synthase [Myxococcota bacterium]|nr:NDP-sugar synthase [Myxococcota bacterium]
MILAAGLGTRMAPLSSTHAKPALPLLDEPLVLRLARQLAAAGAERLVINAHAHPESLREALRDAPLPVDFSLEPELLGSGGGIAAARPALDGEDPFIVANGDMVLDLDLPALLEAHRRAGALVTLALRDDPRKKEFGTIGYDSHGRVRRITSRIDLGGEVGCGLFIGVHVIEPRIFARMPRGAFEILPAVYVPALRDGETLQTWLQPVDERWWPVGSPAELLDANLRALRERGARARCLGAGALVRGALEPPVWIGAGAVVEAGASAGPDAVIGRDARVPRGAALRETLLLPGTRAPARGLRRAIVHADEAWCDA